MKLNLLYVSLTRSFILSDGDVSDPPLPTHTTVGCVTSQRGSLIDPRDTL